MWFNSDSYEAQAHSQISSDKHESKLSHELIAAAASYEAAKAYQDHLQVKGKPVSHEKAKELLAAFAGGYVDRLFESKGLDAFDRERAKHEAQKSAEAALARSGAF